jgi:4-hydroxy-tetrahydrodipicolinate synthase
MSTNVKFRGTYTALITPFSDDKERSIDFNALENLIEWQLDNGVSGFVALGTTAESATLSGAEKVEVIKKVMQFARKRVPIIVGTGSNCTKTSIEQTKLAKELGADGALVVSPYYNKPTQEGLFQHFSAVASEGGLPVILYNIPGRTGVEIATETFARLAKVPNIEGVKEASGSSGKLMEIAEVAAPTWSILAGDDNVTYLVMAIGGSGVISASANAIPKEMSSIVTNAVEDRWVESKAAQVKSLPMIRSLFIETNPAPAKAALKLRGIIASDALRLPLVTVKETTRAALKDGLKGLGYV